MSTVLFWFRSDLRLHDQVALHAACALGAQHLLPVVCLPDLHAATPWGFERIGPHRRAWLANTIQNLLQRLLDKRSQLLILKAPAAIALPALARAVGASTLVCEEIAAPEEQAEVAALRTAGLQVHTVWHSSLLAPACLPWPVQQLPAVFTPFRQAIEHAGLQPAAPLPPPATLPPWPPAVPARYLAGQTQALAALAGVAPATDARSAFPCLQGGQHGQHGDLQARLHGGEAAALAHLAQFLARGLPHGYKRTRNSLVGLDYSSKWSPWLATGALSPRQTLAQLRQFEAAHGSSEGSYWLWFELLWRDYFRFLHLQHGNALYRAAGWGRRVLRPMAPPPLPPGAPARPASRWWMPPCASWLPPAT